MAVDQISGATIEKTTTIELHHDSLYAARPYILLMDVMLSLSLDRSLHDWPSHYRFDPSFSSGWNVLY